MSLSNLVRWNGGVLLLAGVLIAVAFLFHPDDAAHPTAVLTTTWTVVHGCLAAGAVLALLGLAGLYARQAEEAGKLGLVGFVLTFVGLALTVSALVLEAFVIPVIVAKASQLLDPSGPLLGGPLGIVLLLASTSFAFGTILLGIATVRAGVLPRFSALPLIVGAPLLAFQPPLPHLAGLTGSVLVGISFVWIGYALFSGEHVVRSQPSGEDEPAHTMK